MGGKKRPLPHGSEEVRVLHLHLLLLLLSLHFRQRPLQQAATSSFRSRRHGDLHAEAEFTHGKPRRHSRDRKSVV